MTAPTPTPSPVTEHLLRQLEIEEAAPADLDVVSDSSDPAGPSNGDPTHHDVDAGEAAGPANLAELTGLETMARPWRLFLLGLGSGIGLVAWLVVANGQSSLSAPLISVAAAVAALLVGAGLMAIANERDRLGSRINLLAVGVGLAYASVVWMNPTPLIGIDRWMMSQRLLVTLVAFGAGLVLAGVICLATLRRSPTLTVALSILAGVSVLTAVTALRQNEWLGVVLFALAFFLVLGAWDRSPRREVAFARPTDIPRATRAALSLSILALAGAAIDYARHADNRSSWFLPALLVAIGLVVFAISVLFRLQSDMENRDTRLSDWTSWMREIRTNEFRRGFEDMGRSTPQPDAPFADLGEPLRAESDMSPEPTYGDHTFQHSEIPGTSQMRPAGVSEAAVAHAASAEAAGTAASSPFDFATAAAADTLARPTSRPFDFATAAGSDRDVTASTPAVTTPAGAPVLPPSITIPQADADEPPPEPYRAPRPTGNGTFSVFAQPEPIKHDVPSATAFAEWLNTAPLQPPPLFVAIECMYLSEFSALSAAYQSRVVASVARLLDDITPRPDPVAWIDGPYFLAAISPFERRDVMSLNRQLQTLLSSVLTFDDVEIPLHGTLALLTPRDRIAFDQLLDDAVNGLIQARQLEG